MSDLTWLAPYCDISDNLGLFRVLQDPPHVGPIDSHGNLTLGKQSMKLRIVVGRGIWRVDVVGAEVVNHPGECVDNRLRIQRGGIILDSCDFRLLST